MSRGMTMIELLMAIALLSLLMIGVSGWVNVTAGLAAYRPSVTRTAAAEAVAGLIRQDLLMGDARDEPKVEIEDAALLIRTRERQTGAVDHRYLFDAVLGSLVRECAERTESHPRLLLTGLGAWRCELDEEAAWLSVDLDWQDGERRSWRFRVP